MDKEKKEALYFYGTCCNEAGNIEKAKECFKQIYQSDIKYRDVAQKMDAMYDKA